MASELPVVYEKSIETFGVESLLVDFAVYNRKFNFTDLIYSDKREAFDKLKSIEKADFAGSLLQSLIMYKLIDSRKMANEMLSFCNDYILQKSFKLKTIDEMKNECELDIQNIVLVCGCQDKKMFINRVKSAYGFVSKLNRKFIVVFSGLNPLGTVSSPAETGKGVKVLNEARTMNSIFEVLVERNICSEGEKSNVEYRVLEEESTNSEKNIENFLNLNIFKSIPKKKVWIVSSLFHLIKLSKVVEEKIMKFASRGVNSIGLVGAEHPFDDENDIIVYDRYFRCMTVAVFDEILSNKSI